MKYIFLFSIAIYFTNGISAQSTDSIFIKKIYTEALTNSSCYENLRYLCKNIGPRLSGSENAEKAIKFTHEIIEKTGVTKAYYQSVKVPHWVRSEKETAVISFIDEVDFENLRKDDSKEALVKSKRKSKKLNICALGGSIGTPEGGMAAKIIEIHRFSELDSIGRNGIEGKIVFYNSPMDATKINTFEAYGPAVQFRSKGAINAAKYGALAVVVRSVTTAIDDYPHTGAMRYVDTIPKIPACAISTKDAEWLSINLKSNPNSELQIQLFCKTLPDVESANVIGEIKGSKYSNKYIIVGGHLDSWDLAEGAHDDGAGVMQSIEAIKILKNLGYTPMHSLRCVMFMNEENGLRGGEQYAKEAKEKGEIHVAAIETDAGGFAPRGFASEGNVEIKQQLKSWTKLFEPYNLHSFTGNGGGADIYKLKEQGSALYELEPESQRYFDVHHSALDVFENVNKRELELGAASLAALIYLLDQNSK